MKISRKIALIGAAALLFAGVLPAQKVYTVDDVPDVRRADRAGAVSDPDGALSEAVAEAVNGKLAALQRATSVEVAVVVVGSTGDAAPEEFALALFRKWGLGTREKNNGLLILLATGDRAVRFEVGYGLEGVLTDAMSKRIQTTRMMPHLRAGDWDGAVTAAVDAVAELLADPAGGLGNEPEPEAGEGGSPAGAVLFLLSGLVAVVCIAMFAQRRANKCPKCGRQMKVAGSHTARITPTSRRTTTTLRCPGCGHTVTRSATHHSGGGIGGGMLGGGMMGGFGGGRGGFGGGGGWGGGSAGGGGATTRF